MKHSVGSRVKAESFTLGSQFPDLTGQVCHPGIPEARILIQGHSKCLNREAEQCALLGSKRVAMIGLAAEAGFGKETTSGALKHDLRTIEVTTYQSNLTMDDRKNCIDRITYSKEMFAGRQGPGLSLLSERFRNMGQSWLSSGECLPIHREIPILHQSYDLNHTAIASRFPNIRSTTPPIDGDLHA